MAQIAGRCHLQHGDTIGGRYIIERELGKGSFGTVYAAKDHISLQYYAIKLLRLWEVPSVLRNPLMARFDMEYETSLIDSPYLVHSYDHGNVAGNPFIAMEFCPDGDLIGYARHHDIDYRTVARHVLHGLEALHNRGKVHRDLKPENVLVKPNKDFALTDFGISGDRNKRLTEMGFFGNPKQIFGTYAYMPPEQLNPKRNATVLPTTDIFSFGVMMYQLITGELPFGSLEHESDLSSYLTSLRSGKWNSSLLNETYEGRQWNALISGCLEPQFEKRLSSTTEVLKYVPSGGIDNKEYNFDSPDYDTRIRNGVLLRIMQGDEYGKVYRLDDMLYGNNNILTVGRLDNGVHNDINIREANTSYISRFHCTLELNYQIGKWVVRDGQKRFFSSNTSGSIWRASTNGTYVNSREATENGLSFEPGDIISIGDTKLRAEAY